MDNGVTQRVFKLSNINWGSAARPKSPRVMVLEVGATKVFLAFSRSQVAISALGRLQTCRQSPSHSSDCLSVSPVGKLWKTAYWIWNLDAVWGGEFGQSRGPRASRRGGFVGRGLPPFI